MRRREARPRADRNLVLMINAIRGVLDLDPLPMKDGEGRRRDREDVDERRFYVAPIEMRATRIPRRGSGC